MSSFVPPHLRKYVVPQNYKKYSAEDQAVWRFIMKGIQHNLSAYGYKGALKGLQQTDIRQDRIPKIVNIDRKLQKFGWRAACISGFIPPRAFMEFQMHQILPIASELRTIQHIFYTPAPDIVHEAVGHVPFLTKPVFSRFLKTYAQTVLKAIFSKEDMDRYAAIRDLSDLKENPKSTARQIQKQEEKLNTIIKSISHASEAARLSRFIWWTSEYGLMGSLDNPKIYGAGLISSIGESLHIKKVKKIRLSEDCMNYPFDITDFQPQLFVSKNFEHLLEVLDSITHKLAFKRGGIYGLEEALKSQAVNTVELDSGLQISGILEKMTTEKKQVSFIKFSGPVQLSFKNKQLKGHGINYHKEGYSSPLKFLTKNRKPFHLWSEGDLRKHGILQNRFVEMLFEGGIKLKGELKSSLRSQNRLLVLCFTDCRITDKAGRLLYDPSWGPFDLAAGSQVSSVFSGPADRKAYKEIDDFEPSKVPQKIWSKKQQETFKVYKKVARLKTLPESSLKALLSEIKKQDSAWLLILELLVFARNKVQLKKQILKSMGPIAKIKLQGKKVFQLGREFYRI